MTQLSKNSVIEIVLIYIYMYIYIYIYIYIYTRGDISCFPQDERDGITFITITSVAVGKY